MSDKILFVDDDKSILDAFKRQFRKNFNMDFALGPLEGLEKMKNGCEYAAVVSDLRMPHLDGIEFLSKVKAFSPDTVRIMLTGNADVDSAVKAINDGEIFRFLTKPVSSVALSRALYEAIRYYKLLISEKELLENTLKESIGVLSDLNAMINPEIFGRSGRIKRISAMLARTLKLDSIWHIETAAMLSLIGTIVLNPYLVEKYLDGGELSSDEMVHYCSHCETTYELISKIPRMGVVARAIKFQEKYYNGGGYPDDSVQGQDIPIESRILKAATDFDRYSRLEGGVEKALKIMDLHNTRYDPTILAALNTVSGIEDKFSIVTLLLNMVSSDDIFVEEVRTENGILLVSRGQQVTELLAKKLKLLYENGKIQKTVSVMKTHLGKN
ncbi:MAG: response regulator [Deltaproteobacteria bacterium]|nr:response regulator [Deltaproteobacteria bacterium]